MIRIVIANFNGEKYIEACLRAVLAQQIVGLEVVVVDDASIDRSVEIIKNISKVKLIKLQKNGGPARARNQGAKGFKGEYLLFLDVDTVVFKGSIKDAVREMERDEKIGAGQFDLVDHHGHFLSWFGMPYQASALEKEIFGGITAALIVKRRVFEKIGGFDEDYQIYGEDTDLCWRIWLAGYEVRRLMAKARHVGKSSINFERVYYNGARNSLRSIVKNADPVLVVPMVILNGIFWLCLAGYKAFRGKGKEAKWIVGGCGRGMVEIKRSLKKRGNVIRVKDNRAGGMMFGKMGFLDIVKKGWGWANEN